MRPYYEHEGITIYHGDCRDVLLGLADQSVDVVVTSPPYNMGLTPGGNGRGVYKHTTQKAHRFSTSGYGSHDDAMPAEAYDEWQRGSLLEMWRLARLAVFYNHRPRIEHGVLRVPLSWSFGLPLRQIIIWDRVTGIDVNLRHFCTRQEWILLFAKPTFTLVDHSASGMGDVWRLGMEYSETGHPAPFPVSLPSRCLTATGAASVLDPFMGSGSTLVAAKRLGRKAIGVDIEEKYCEIAAERLAQSVLDFGTEPYLSLHNGALIPHV